MDKALVNTGDSPNRLQDSKFKFESAFNAELEIAEVFGSLPWRSQKLDASDKPGNKVSKDPPRPMGFGFEPVMPATSAFNIGGFDDQLQVARFGPSINKPREARSKCGLPQLTVNKPLNDAAENVPPCASSKEYGFSSPAPTPPLSTFPSSGIFANRNATMSSRSPIVSGFGCSNEAIARLPGRSRGRGRRGNSGRRRSGFRADIRMPPDNRNSVSHETAVFSHPPPSTAFGCQPMNNNNITTRFAFNPFASAPPPPLEQKTKVEEKIEPVVLGGRRPNAFVDEHKAEETACKRRRVVCFICMKTGHTGEDCFRNPKNQSSRDVIRCYNCNERGHMAVRCTKPPMKGPRARRSASPRRGRKEKNEKAAKDNVNTAMQANNMKGLEVICKLMKDRNLRSETERNNPQLYDEMLSLMIAHVNIGINNNK